LPVRFASATPGFDRNDKPSPIAYPRNAELLQILHREVRKNRLVDPVVAERGLIFAETETTKPPADIHGGAPHGRTEYLRSLTTVSSVAFDYEVEKASKTIP
jgi:hypothetical protein